MTRTCGVVLATDDLLYLGDPGKDKVFQERKSFSRLDFADEEFAVSITDSDSLLLTIDLVSTSDIVVGFTIRQETREAVVLSVDSATKITVDVVRSWTVATATVFEPIQNIIEWVLVDAANPGIMKHFRNVALILNDANFETVDVSIKGTWSGFETETLSSLDVGGAWGLFPWGSLPWGQSNKGKQPLLVGVPLSATRAHWIFVRAEIKQAFTSFSISGISVMYSIMSERFGRHGD